MILNQISLFTLVNTDWELCISLVMEDYCYFLTGWEDPNQWNVEDETKWMVLNEVYIFLFEEYQLNIPCEWSCILSWFALVNINISPCERSIGNLPLPNYWYLESCSLWRSWGWEILTCCDWLPSINLSFFNKSSIGILLSGS